VHANAMIISQTPTTSSRLLRDYEGSATKKAFLLAVVTGNILRYLCTTASEVHTLMTTAVA
jgi:hypothetical protein